MSKRKNEFRPRRPKPDFEAVIDALVFEACAEYGFCGDPDCEPFDRTRRAWTAEEFALEVLRAEGLEPIVIQGIGPSQSEYFVMIRDLFLRRVGASIRVDDTDAQQSSATLQRLGGCDPAAKARRRRR
ncbi:MAG: hypothetical protein AB7Q23_16430 [Hyphomonadaceae bacterium]